MHELIISWPSGMKTFSPADSPVILGRSLESSVVVSELTASRRHLTFTWSDGTWVAEDVSTHGSFSSTGEALDKSWALTDDCGIRLGDPQGQAIEIKLSITSKTTLAPPLPLAAQEYQMSTVFDESNPLPDVHKPGVDADQEADDIDNRVDDVLSPLPDHESALPDLPPLTNILPGSPPPPNEQLTDVPALDTPAADTEPHSDGPASLPVSNGVPPMPSPALSGEQMYPTPSFTTPPEPLDPFVSSDKEDGGRSLESTELTPEQSRSQFAGPILEETIDKDQRSTVDAAAEALPEPGVDKPPFDPIDPPPLPMTEQIAPEAEPSTDDSESTTPPLLSNISPDAAPPTSPNHQPPVQPFTAMPDTVPPTPGDTGQALPNFQKAAPPVQTPNTPLHPGNFGVETTDHWASQPSVTAVQNHSLRVEVDNKHHIFQPHQEVTIGRDQGCNIVLDKRHSLASRQHVRITFRNGTWWMEDFSSKGTFVDGTQIKNPYEATGGFKALLGNRQAGAEIKVVAPGEHKTNTKRRWPLVAALAAAAVLLLTAIGVGVVVTQGDDEAAPTTVSEDQMEAAFLDLAKRSTVLIVTGNDQGLATGSGFFVSDNLVVTNQHVVEGDDLLEIAVSNGNDDPVELTYVGTVLERHPFLDIAVVQLTGELVPVTPANQDPNLETPGFTVGPLQAGNNASVEVGSSDGLILGTTVFSTGFPGSFNSAIGFNDTGDLQLPPVGIDSGDASSLASWPGCNNPTADSAIPQNSPVGVNCNDAGDVKNAVVTTSLTSGPGASGSPVYQDGKVVAVVFAGAAGETETNSGRSIMTSSFKDWLGPIITAN